MRPADPVRRHCHTCDQDVYRGVSGYGPWCDLYTAERREPCRAMLARALDQLIADADLAEQESLELMVEKRFGFQWRAEL